MSKDLVYQVEGSENLDNGIGPIYRNILSKDGLKKNYYPGCNTIYDLFKHGVKEFPNDLCLGRREFVKGKFEDHFTWKTYSEVSKIVDDLANGLLQKELIKEIPFDDHKTQSGSNYKLIGIFSKNRMEWVISEEAIFSVNATIIPLYDSFTPDAIKCILEETGLETIICGSSEAHIISDIMKEQNSEILLKNLIVFDPITDELKKLSESYKIEIITYQSIIDIGSKSKLVPTPPNELDPAFIFYTSGTTGSPKGVIITHQNMASVSSAGLAHHELVRLAPGSFYLSYLPLPHVFEQFIQGILLSSGGAIGFYSGDKAIMLEDLKILRPTIFASVPRIYGRMKDKVLENVSKAGGIKAWLFHKGLNAKIYNLQYNTVSHWFYDRLLFLNIRRVLGFDRITLCVTGSAPMSVETNIFLKCLFCSPLIQGFGMTESAGGVACGWPGDVTTSADCGIIVQNCEMRLLSVHEMGYTVKDKYHGRIEENGKVINEGVECIGRGELVYRGFNTTPGRPDITAQVIDKDGWFHSGDIALITPEYKLQIIDRIKNILKLSQGEYVSVENLENLYQSSKYIDQIFVYGDSFQSFLVAIIVPDESSAKTWAEENNISDKSLSALCSSKEFKRVVLSEIEKIAKSKKLNGIERIRNLYLEPIPFSVEEGMLTPTMKLRRIDLKRKYEETIHSLYK